MNFYLWFAVWLVGHVLAFGAGWFLSYAEQRFQRKLRKARKRTKRARMIDASDPNYRSKSCRCGLCFKLGDRGDGRPCCENPPCPWCAPAYRRGEVRCKRCGCLTCEGRCT